MTRLMVFLAAIFLMVFAAGAVMAQAPDTCEFIEPGDANSDGVHNVGDAIYLIHFFLGEGPAPEPLANGDFDGDCDIDSMDAYNALMYAFKCKGVDKCGYVFAECTCQEPVIGDFYHDLCFGTLPGDANNDGYVQIGDVVFLISYIFKLGPTPEWYTPIRGDANCDCNIDVSDAVYILNYVFRSGPPPCSCDEILDGCDINKTSLIVEWMLQS